MHSIANLSKLVETLDGDHHEFAAVLHADNA